MGNSLASSLCKDHSYLDGMIESMPAEAKALAIKAAEAAGYKQASQATKEEVQKKIKERSKEAENKIGQLQSTFKTKKQNLLRDLKSKLPQKEYSQLQSKLKGQLSETAFKRYKEQANQEVRQKKNLILNTLDAQCLALSKQDLKQDDLLAQLDKSQKTSIIEKLKKKYPFQTESAQSKAAADFKKHFLPDQLVKNMATLDAEKDCGQFVNKSIEAFSGQFLKGKK